MPDSPRRGRGHSHGRLREALINEALAFMRETQRIDFTLRALARRAGVSHNAPYNHFESKDALLDDIAILGFQQLETTMRDATLHHNHPVDALNAIGEAYVRFGVANPALYRLMFGPQRAAGGLSMNLKLASERSFNVLTTTLQRCADGGFLRTPYQPAHGLTAWSTVHGLTQLLLDERTSVAVEFSETLIADVLGLMSQGLILEPST